MPHPVPSDPIPPARARLLACVALLVAAGCTGTRTLADPTLVIETSGGRELGVSTDYGLVFLGRTAQKDKALVTAWFGDGPQVESATIEPVGAGLFTAETEIRLPQVLMSFSDPKPGTEVLVIGRNRHGLWQSAAEVRADPRVLGILITIPSELRDDPTQVGAGVYVVPDGDEDHKLLLGLVSGVLTIPTEGGERSYACVIGPQDLWRLVAHRRELQRRRHWVYRDDIM
jgi:hypothetical protein